MADWPWLLDTQARLLLTRSGREELSRESNGQIGTSSLRDKALSCLFDGEGVEGCVSGDWRISYVSEDIVDRRGGELTIEDRLRLLAPVSESVDLTNVHEAECTGNILAVVCGRGVITDRVSLVGTGELITLLAVTTTCGFSSLARGLGVANMSSSLSESEDSLGPKSGEGDLEAGTCKTDWPHLGSPSHVQESLNEYAESRNSPSTRIP
jgi:hypothetical protein